MNFSFLSFHCNFSTLHSTRSFADFNIIEDVRRVHREMEKEKCLLVNTSIKVCSFSEFSFSFASLQTIRCCCMHCMQFSEFFSCFFCCMKNEQRKVCFSIFLLRLLVLPHSLASAPHYTYFSTTHSYNKTYFELRDSSLPVIFIKKLLWHSTEQQLASFLQKKKQPNGGKIPERARTVCEK